MGESIIFLGTAGDIYTVAKQTLASGGIIIQMQDLQFHLDPGPGSLIRAAQSNINLRETTAILVSHSHTTHSADVNAVISAMTYNGLDKKGVLITPDVSIVSDFHKNCLEKYIQIQEKQKIGIEDIEIHTFPTRHCAGSVGYKFLTPDFTLVYLSDTEYCAELAEHLEGCNLLIMCVTNPQGEKSQGQLSIDDATKILIKVKPNLAIITHYGFKMVKADQLDQARILQQNSKIQVIAAKDGLVVTPQSYSVSPKQKNLLGIRK